MRVERRRGDTYQATIRVLKARRGRPTVVEIDGERYVWMPRDMYMGGRRSRQPQEAANLAEKGRFGGDDTQRPYPSQSVDYRPK
ncbi:MAG: hypothetical protein DIU69_08650 [Bacillota bacterium]|nr:MAG: hypothetical protein DIU69_08650 [Bacillota bacterium]